MAGLYVTPLNCALLYAGSAKLQVCKLEPVLLHAGSKATESGMKSQSMLPEPSSRNIRLGFTTELAVFAIGAVAMSVNAAFTVVIARLVQRTSATLVKIKLVGEVRF